MKIKRFEILPAWIEIHTTSFSLFLKELLCHAWRAFRLFKFQPVVHRFPSGEQTPVGPPIWRLFYPVIKWVRSDGGPD